MGAISPGQRVLTVWFATRGSRVQIPSAPPGARFRGDIGSLESLHRLVSVFRRGAGVAQDVFRVEHLAMSEGVTGCQTVNSTTTTETQVPAALQDAVTHTPRNTTAPATRSPRGRLRWSRRRWIWEPIRLDGVFR